MACTEKIKPSHTKEYSILVCVGRFDFSYNQEFIRNCKVTHDPTVNMYKMYLGCTQNLIKKPSGDRQTNCPFLPEFGQHRAGMRPLF